MNVLTQFTQKVKGYERCKKEFLKFLTRHKFFFPSIVAQSILLITERNEWETSHCSKAYLIRNKNVVILNQSW